MQSLRLTIKASLRAISFAVLVSAPACPYAQDQLLGKYTGNFITTTRTGGGTPRSFGLELIIEGVENGVVKAALAFHGINCFGNYPMEGKLNGDQLQLRATRKGGLGGDCQIELTGTVEGNKIVGRLADGSPVQLSK